MFVIWQGLTKQQGMASVNLPGLVPPLLPSNSFLRPLFLLARDLLALG